jgi:predicted DNA-binding ArsR family transcriptional regulator
MASKIKITNGNLVSVYDDRFAALFHALGSPDIKRATDVEYDDTSREWVATLRATGEVIGRGTNRADVIKQEVKWLEERL